MRKKLGFGAGFALTAAVIAIGGCSDKKTIIQGSQSGELNNNGFPASSIATNNLASDGGGFSENNQQASFALFTCQFNYTHPESDSVSTADKSGMFFFVTADSGTTSGAANREHVWVSYWNGSSFTPPQEITGADRNESLGTTSGADQRGTHPAATVMIPMNTSAYVGNTGTANARVRANNGNWLLLWDGNTFTQNQVLQGIGVTTAGVQQNTAVGPHHTVWATVFIKNLASQPIATTNLIGNLAATGTANGPAIECVYGFQRNGSEITTYRNGTGSGGAAGQVAGFTTGGNALVKPAEDIASFGAASDTFVGCASFSASNDNVSGLANGAQLGTRNGGRFLYGPNTTTPDAVNNPNVNPASADYSVGDSTTFIQLFWVQLVTSGTGLTRQSTTFTPSNSTGTVHLGPQYQLLTANFNLSTMTIGGGATPFLAADAASSTAINPPVTRNTYSDARDAQAQPYANFTTYNNMLFWSYQDTSLAIAPSGGPGTVEAVINNNGSRVLSTLAIIPGPNGDATTANQNDVTLLGTGGRHQVTNNTNNVANGILVGEESVFLGPCDGCGIIGPDEGQVDIVAFVLGTVTTQITRGGGTSRLGTLGSNTDQELWAVAFQSTGATAGSLQAFTNNPRRVSQHVADLPFPTTTNTNDTSLADDVNDLKIQSSRDGTYNVLAWRQAINTSISANLSLFGTVYKVFRAVAATGSATSPTVPTLDQRFPTAAPIQINAPSPAYTTGQRTGFGTGYTAAFASAPVVAYEFQGNIAYRCGFQGDRTKMSILWAYDDATEARLFIKLLTIGTGTLNTDNPTITATGESEIDPNDTVPGFNVNNLQTGTQRSSFSFLPGSFGGGRPSWSFTGGAGNVFCSSLEPTTDRDGVLSVDAGPNVTGGNGDVLVVFSKVVSATNGNYDRQVISVLYNQTAIADRVVISRAGIESAGGPPGGFTGGASPAAYPTGFKTVLWGLNPNTSSASLSTAGRSPDNGTYIYFGGPATNNSTSARALYTRHFRARRATQGGTAVTFANTFFPPVSAATGDAAFRAPVRIDRAQGNSDATPIYVFKKARQAVVVFTQDNHLWGTVTNDGEDYTDTNGQPDAFVVDNNTSVSQSGHGLIKFRDPDEACQLIDSNCDNLSGTPLFFIKDDVNLNDRLYVRVMQ